MTRLLQHHKKRSLEGAARGGEESVSRYCSLFFYLFSSPFSFLNSLEVGFDDRISTDGQEVTASSLLFTANQTTCLICPFLDVNSNLAVYLVTSKKS